MYALRIEFYFRQTRGVIQYFPRFDMQIWEKRTTGIKWKQVSHFHSFFISNPWPYIERKERRLACFRGSMITNCLFKQSPHDSKIIQRDKKPF